MALSCHEIDVQQNILVFYSLLQRFKCDSAAVNDILRLISSYNGM